MPTSDRPQARFAVSVDEYLLEEDLAHTTAAGRAAIAPVIDQLKRTGVPKSRLKRCQTEGRDGTQLAGCVKLYIPHPNGPWGAVLTGDKLATIPTLVLLAAGRRHPVQPWTPSVYQVAHKRLPQILARDLRGKEPNTPPAAGDDTPEG
jgi:hypothetical protein